MGLSLVTPPTIEPVSLAEAKAHLRVTEADDDALIAGYILAARHAAESYIRGALITQTWDYSLDYCWPVVSVRGMCKYRTELPLHPIQSVTSVSYVDENGTTQTLSPSLYTVHIRGPVAYIEKAYDQDFPSIRSVPEAITVRFVVGYQPDAVPDPIKAAIMLGIERLYDRCGDEGMVDQARTALLDPYRVLRVA
jgi:uncharacterized phiE125 gp8 family phage protein